MKYRVNFAKAIWFSTEVEAEEEITAIEEAMNREPRICAHCSGWNEKWSVSDDDEWQTIEEFHGERHDPEVHGVTVEHV